MRALYTIAIVVFVALAGTGCAGMTVYYRGTPKRVDTEVRKGEAQVTVDVEQTTSNELYAVVFEHTGIDVDRVLVYNTVMGVAEHKWYMEFVEVPLGALWLGPALISLPVALTLPDTPSQVYKQPNYTLAAIFGPINPFQGAFFVDWVIYHDVDEYTFKTAPKRATFTKSRPVEGARVAYAWQDAAGAIVAQGRGATDPFGRFPIAPAPTGTERLFVRLGDGPPVAIAPELIAPVSVPETAPAPPTGEPGTETPAEQL